MRAPGVRSFVKGLAEKALVSLGAPALLRLANHGRGLVLAYHNVVPHGARPGGDRSLHLARSEFAGQLDLLTETHRVVDLATLLTPGRGDSQPPLAAITIDDAYRGAMTVGLEELEARSLPCTVFVAPALIGSGPPWWDALAPKDGSFAESVRERLLTQAKGCAEEVEREAARGDLTRRRQPDHARIVNEGELRDAASRSGVTLGSHGWSHVNLTRLQGPELREELRRPLDWLQEQFPQSVVPWLSLPYGRTSQSVVEAALDAGYEGVLDLSKRLLPTDAVGTTVPRINVPAGVSREGFQLLTAGL